MAGSVNKVILIGNLGKDPEIRRLENGVVVANFPLATSETFVDKVTGERRETTDWHTIVLWRGLAEVAEKYARKGQKIYVEGKLKNRSWQDKDGNTRYTTEVLGESMTLLTPKSENDRPAQTNTPPYPTEPGSNPSPMDLNVNFEDDLPF
ncbi:MAG: single-stranded DNA-binding protein [Candidatus Fluviicola riflensis]|nr:MAG: single-stranded DNA-binding protein [Candidatus Fluviicola riflensis]OGS78887.1 MAG: single-stranded DNA-binding protein [Candidatus Fluviicola riflensis]OGS85909.1 MAG: single-stranded DNA-binding protein [Fluviicola sp. RIFCSPHIGHO2_12_FULL_43_24]OGS86318.1 MAG: single-stranded DNA-binding protein [Fluviicola sp. RIFCSPHIGHO2_01_FULL_43_53]